MKKHIKDIITALIIASLLPSCGIPIGYTGNEIAESRLYGQRFGKDGTVLSSIEYRMIRHNIHWLISIEGPGLHPMENESYFLITPEKTYKLSHLENLTSKNVFLDQFLPVNDTNLWIAFELIRVERNEVDIKTILFDEAAKFQETIITHCLRLDTSASSFYKINSYGIKPSQDNKHVLFQTKNGDVIYLIEDNKLVKTANQALH